MLRGVMMGWQDGFNALMGVGLVVFGWMLRGLGEAIRDLRNEDKGLAEKVSTLSTRVATEYVHKGDLRELSAGLFIRLDRIEEKIDRKADKQ